MAPETYRLKDTRLAHVDEGQFGAWTPFGFFRRANTDAVMPRRINGSYYVEVTRQSMAVEHSGVTPKPGWWHFEARGTGMYLKVTEEGFVMDYTCPRWLVDAPSWLAETREIHPWPAERHDDHNAWKPFTRPFLLKCIHSWCTPVDCQLMRFNGSFIDGSRNPAPVYGGVHMNNMNHPAYWKWDPPYWEHHLHAYGVVLVVCFWPGTNTDNFQWVSWETSGMRMVVDYRFTNVKQADYSGGAYISCPEDRFSHYFVSVQAGVMEKCVCNRHAMHLNCGQLSSLQGEALARPAARVVCHSRNGSLLLDRTSCNWKYTYSQCIKSLDCDPDNTYVLYPPLNTTACVA